MASLQPESRKVHPDLGIVRNCLRFIWNPEKRAFLDRTATSWGAFLLFYLIFMGALAAIFVFMGWIALLNISGHNTPWFQLETSRIGSSPGLGFRPVLHLTSPLIWYKWNGIDISYKAYIKEMDKFFKNYGEFNPDKHEDCSRDVLPRERIKACYFNVSHLEDCAPPYYGYEQMAPCVYIKLNKIYGWSPECYNETINLPGEMPSYLRNYIMDKPAGAAGNVHEMNTVWLSCVGYFPADSQHMGEIEFYPKPGFKAVYFPYLGQEGYMSPLIAIKFWKPMRDLLITVRCRVWARNIIDGAQGGGPVDFQLMIGDMN